MWAWTVSIFWPNENALLGSLKAKKKDRFTSVSTQLFCTAAFYNGKVDCWSNGCDVYSELYALLFCQCEGSSVLVKAMESTIPWCACQPIVFITHDCYTQRMHFEVSHSHTWVPWFPPINILYSWYAWKRRWHIGRYISFNTREKKAPTEAEVSQIFHLLMLEVIINPGVGFGHKSGSNETAVPQSADLSLMGSRFSPLSPATY